jgi:hypothetical protein
MYWYRLQIKLDYKQTNKAGFFFVTAVNIRSDIVVLLGKLIITFDEATAYQLYLYGRRQTQVWRCRCKKLSSPSIGKYIPAANKTSL